MSQQDLMEKVPGADSDAEGRKRSYNLVRLPDDLVARLEQRHVSNGRRQIMTSLGISYNSWRKIQMGLPIRASVADRLRRSFSED